MGIYVCEYMSICVCFIYACLKLSMYLHTYVYAHACCVLLLKYVCMHPFMYAHAQMHPDKCLKVHCHVCFYGCINNTYIHACLYAWTHTDMNTNFHTYSHQQKTCIDTDMYTCIHTCVCECMLGFTSAFMCA